MLDLPTIPAFGRIPVTDDIGLVVAVRPVLDPAAASQGMRGADWQPRPALAVTTSEGQYDTIASRFELSGPSRYHRERDPTATTAAIAVEPAVTGVLVERIAGCDRKTLRTVDTSLTVRLEEPTRGTIDGHPQLFPVGEYTVTALPRRYFRVAG